MISPHAQLRVSVSTRPMDFRKGIDGLALAVQEVIGLDPFSGAALASGQDQDLEASVRGSAARPGSPRTELAALIIAASRPWLETQLSRIPQSSRLVEDIRYTLGIWPGLTRFLEAGRLKLDTNPVEGRRTGPCSRRSSPPAK